MSAGDEAVRLNYEVLVSRHQAVQSTLWTMISMSLAAEAALWVGLTTLPLGWQESLLFAGAFAMVGGLAPLSVRFFEISSMLDRQLMDAYEEKIGLPSGVPLLLHGLRLQDRLDRISTRDLSSEQVAHLHKRLLTKNLGERGLWASIDRCLTKAGQPSMMWTSVISFAGVAGATTAIGLAGHERAWTVATLLATFGLMSGLWLLSMGTHRVIVLFVIGALLVGASFLTVRGLDDKDRRTVSSKPTAGVHRNNPTGGVHHVKRAKGRHHGGRGKLPHPRK